MVSFRTFWGWQLTLFPEKTFFHWLISPLRLMAAYRRFMNQSELYRHVTTEKIKLKIQSSTGVK